jgi:hypothetical protein
MKQFVIGTLVALVVVASGSNVMADTTLEAQKKIIMQELQIRIRYIGTQAQLMLQKNDFNNASAIMQWQRVQVQRAIAEAALKIRQLQLAAASTNYHR